jgi:GH25 family lysozyme M1 (1,4-beta-N-acetylmuramidase)
MLFQGIDVSSCQGIIDWNDVASANKTFAICKCYTGNDGKDSLYDMNIKNAHSAGLKTACYHFVYPLQTDPNHPNRDPIDQANLHFNNANGQPAFIDVEWPAPQDWSHWNIDATFIKNWLTSYLQEYTNLDNNRIPAIYCYPNFAQNLQFDDNFAQYPLWLASYFSTANIFSPWSDFQVWQYSGSGQCSGIKVPVDLDYCKDITTTLFI